MDRYSRFSKTLTWLESRESWFLTPTHLFQGGNKRKHVFCKDQDYQTYLELMSQFRCGAKMKPGPKKSKRRMSREDIPAALTLKK